MDLQDITNYLQDAKGAFSSGPDILSPPFSADDAASVSSAGSCGRQPSCHSTESAVSVQALQPRRRRGGYKDGGGLATEGQPVVCPVVHITSERELREELERIAAALALSVEWDRRVQALAQCEAVAVGSAAACGSLVDLFRALLRDLISQQIADRRSAVSRQACHLVGRLAEVLGHAFAGLALHFIDDLLKMVVITIQACGTCARIMAEAADAALATVLRHCRAAALLPHLALPLAADRSAKLRQCCAAHLLQVLEEWQPAEWRRAMQPVARGVAAACGDSAAATRTLGRQMYAALAAKAPDAASSALEAMSPTAQRQLFAAAATAAPPAPSRGVGSKTAGQHSSRPRSQPHSRPDSASSSAAGIDPARYTAAEPAGGCTPAPATAATPLTPWTRVHAVVPDDSSAHVAGCPATVGAPPRRSVGLPQRLSAGPHRAQEPLQGGGAVGAAGAAHGAAAAPSVAGWGNHRHAEQRLSAPAGRQSQLGRPPRRVSQAVPPAHMPSAAGSAAAVAEQPRPEADHGGGRAPSLRSLVVAIQGAGGDCGARAAAYDGLRLLLWEARRDAAPELAAEAGALLPLLAEHLGSPHARVATAAAGALSAASVTCGPTLEPHLDRFLAALFGAAVSPRLEVAAAACRALAAAGLQTAAASFDPELLLAGCAAAVLAVRGGARGRCAVLDFFSQQLAPRLAQQPAGGGGSMGASNDGSAPGSRAMRAWLRRITPLADDKHPDIRAAAAAALAAAAPRGTAATPAPDSLTTQAQCGSSCCPPAQVSPTQPPQQPALPPCTSGGPDTAPQHSPGDIPPHTDMHQLREAASTPSPPPPAAAAKASPPPSPAGPATAVAAVPGTPPQLPARPARAADASEDGGARVDCSGSGGAAAAAATAAGPAAAASSAGEQGPAGLPAAPVACIAAQLEPDAASPFDRALAAHLAARHPAAGGGGSEGMGLHTNEAAPSSHGAGGQSITAVLPCEPVVHSFGRSAAPGAEACTRPHQQAQLQESEQQQQQPPQEAEPMTDVLASAVADVEQPLSDLPASTAPSSRLPAGRLRGLAAQQLSPPPWAQPAVLTPTGHTAQALKSGLLTQLATAASPPEAASGSAAAQAGTVPEQDVASAGAAGAGTCEQDRSIAPGLSVQGHQISLRRQPPRTPARVSAPAAPLPASRLGPSHYAQAAAALHHGAVAADKPVAGQDTSLSTAPAPSAAHATAPPPAVSNAASSAPRLQPAASRLSIAERAAAALDGCTTDADRREAALELASLAAAAPTALLAAVAPRLLSCGTDASDVLATQAALAGVKAAITALPEASLAAAAEHGGMLLPPLFSAFRHPTPDVRKAAVMALVELCLKLGDGAEPLLRPLAPSQAKLVAIYVQRARVAAA